jgi:hypothetical protein
MRSKGRSRFPKPRRSGVFSARGRRCNRWLLNTVGVEINLEFYGTDLKTNLRHTREGEFLERNPTPWRRLAQCASDRFSEAGDVAQWVSLPSG